MDSFLPVFYELLKVFGVKNPSEGMKYIIYYRYVVSVCDGNCVWVFNGSNHCILHYEDSAA